MEHQGAQGQSLAHTRLGRSVEVHLEERFEPMYVCLSGDEEHSGREKSLQVLMIPSLLFRKQVRTTDSEICKVAANCALPYCPLKDYLENNHF